MKKIRLAGCGGRTRANLPTEFKIRVLQLVDRDNMNHRDAMAQAASEWSNLELKESYRKYPGSHIGRFRDFVRECLMRGDQTVIQLVLEADLPVEIQDEASVEE